ncbi:MAG: glycosyltransferase [Fervidicoccaceae archaeon]
MDVAIFTMADHLRTGGNYRLFKVLNFLPKNKYVLLIPQNKKFQLINDIRFLNNHEKSSFLEIVNSAITLPPIKEGALNYTKYAYMVYRTAKKLGASLVYFPHEANVYVHLGFRIAGRSWTALLQQTPVVGSLTYEGGRGFSLFYKNMEKLNLTSIKVIKAYIRFNIFRYASHGIPLLAVSASIPYELEKLGIKRSIKVLRPGVGVEECPYAYNQTRDIDLLYFARIIPEKGIFDFIEIARRISRVRNNTRIAIMGATAPDMAEKVKATLAEAGIRAELFFNASRDLVLRNLSRAKMVIYPSRIDAFPLAVLEALSCGTPVIAYNIPAIRFNYTTPAVKKVGVGYIKEAVKKALDLLQGDAWKDLSKEAISFASRYKWEDVAKAEWSTLQEIMNTY